MNNHSSWLWGIPKLEFTKYHLCDAYQLRKNTRSSFHSIKGIITTITLEILHIDLFRSIRTISLGGKTSRIVIVYDFQDL